MATRETPDLPMAPMVALFALLVVFMIQFYAASGATLNVSNETQLPTSTSTEQIEQAVQIEVTQRDILVEGVRVASVGELGGSDLNVPALAAELTKHKERTERIAARNPSVTFDGRLILLADKKTKYDTVTRIMFTSGQVGYNKINMAVIQKGG